jgi:hypothetical protein
MPHPGRQWAEHGGRHKDPEREPRRRRRATYNRYGGVRHLFAALDLAKDKLYGHIKPVKKRTQFKEQGSMTRRGERCLMRHWPTRYTWTTPAP